MILISSNHEPALWSLDTDQQIPCFGRSQLIIERMFNINYIRCKPRLHDLVLARVVKSEAESSNGFLFTR